MEFTIEDGKLYFLQTRNGKRTAQAALQLSLIHIYLKNKKIGIGQPADPFDYMTREEIDYLEEYLKAVQAGADVTDGVKEAVLLSAMAGDADAKHRLIEIFLPQVAEIAKLYAGQGVFLEDLIGEGNVALTMAAEMLDCAQNEMCIRDRQNPPFQKVL